jgi:RimJ/RimL family protein N-acetyltransferase
MVALQEIRKPVEQIYLEPIAHTQKTLDLWVKWMNDPDIRKWMYDDLPSSPEDINNWLYNATYDARRHYFAIQTSTNKQIGFVSLRQDLQPNTTGEIGIIIGEKDYQSRGVGTQTIDAMLIYAKDNLHLSSIRALIKPDNEKSIRLFSKMGFAPVGEVTSSGTSMIRFEKTLV